MTDYTRATGNTGTMLIRDTGTTVEFWLKAGSQTSQGRLPWRYTINGSQSAILYYDFDPGGAYQRLGAWTITSDQTVTFYIGDSGTSGLGGPTTFSQFINRNSIPAAPDKPTISQLKDVSAVVSFTDNDNGGLTVSARQLSYGKTATASDTVVTYSGATTLSGLTPRTPYYVKARVQNSKGWSGWSLVTSFTTLDRPAAPQAPTSVTAYLTETSMRLASQRNDNGGSAILEWEFGYGPNIAQPLLFVRTAGSDRIATVDIAGLSAGTKVYAWARARNAFGWSDWSGRTPVDLRTGATGFTLQGTTVVPKKAVAFVKYNGVWKVARPFSKIAGLWKETS